MMSKTIKKLNVIQKGNDGQDITESITPVYEKPVLKNYGDVRDVTLGPTGQPTESGSSSSNPRCNPSLPNCP